MNSARLPVERFASHLPERRVSRQIVASLVKAIQQRLRVEVNYISLLVGSKNLSITSRYLIVQSCRTSYLNPLADLQIQRTSGFVSWFKTLICFGW